jgi:hypothetical protein
MTFVLSQLHDDCQGAFQTRAGVTLSIRLHCIDDQASTNTVVVNLKRHFGTKRLAGVGLNYSWFWTFSIHLDADLAGNIYPSRRFMMMC